MPISLETFATRRHLPHLQRPEKTYFVTFTTRDRSILDPEEREIVLNCCVHDHGIAWCLYCAVVMPDHVHLIATPYDQWTLPRVLRRVKGISSRRINQRRGVRGSLWLSESFDRIVRTAENMRVKAEYVCENPVRAGISATADEYPWKWRLWVEGGQAGLPVLHDDERM